MDRKENISRMTGLRVTVKIIIIWIYWHRKSPGSCVINTVIVHGDSTPHAGEKIHLQV